MEKTKVFNLVILDKSGSMESVRQAAIDGFNEVLSGIKHSQQEYAATQEQNVTLVVFSGEQTSIVYDMVAAEATQPLTIHDYRPYGMTPLYDAVGMSLYRLEHRMEKMEDAAAIVTIITDGLENASREFTRERVYRLISDLKEKGWSFTLMGANQDSRRTAGTLGISNSHDFAFSNEGVGEAFGFTRRWSAGFSSRLHHFKEQEAGSGFNFCMADRRSKYSKMADEAFNEEDDNGSDNKKHKGD